MTGAGAGTGMGVGAGAAAAGAAATGGGAGAGGGGSGLGLTICAHERVDEDGTLGAVETLLVGALGGVSLGTATGAAGAAG